MRWSLPSAALAAAALGLCGCEGSLNGAPSGPYGGPSGSAGVEGAVSKCTVRAVGPTPLRHLTRHQYARTVEDLIGVSIDASTLPEDDDTQGYEVGASMSNLLVEGYADRAAEAAAAFELSQVLSCEPDPPGDTTCRDAFVAAFGRRAYRRSLSAEDVTGLTALFDAGATESRGGFEGGVRLVVEGALQSPHFLYHVLDSVEPDGDGLRRLTDFALANRLSYLVWGSMPDEPLLDAAEAGQLRTADDVEGQLRRMLESRPQAARLGARSFVHQWLELDRLAGMHRDPTLFPDYSPDLSEDLEESLLRTVDSALWDSENSFEALLTSDRAWVNAEVAALFNEPAPTGDLWEEVSLDSQERRGVLTHPGLIAALSKPNQSDPVIRGKFVRERLLCEQLQPPPPNVATTPPDPTPGATTRERFAEHTESEACQVCHEKMDPIGFGLENYDALGQFRLEDQGLPVDAAGEIVGETDAAGPFEGALELAEQLAASADAHDCMALQYFRFAVGRVETEQDGCSVEKTTERFDREGGSFIELLAGIVRSETFRFTQEAP